MEKQVRKFFFHPLKVFCLVIFPILMYFPYYGLTNGLVDTKKIIVIIAFSLFLAFYSYHFIVYLYYVVTEKPVIELDSEFLMDRLSKLKLEWKDISELKLFSSKGFVHISIKLSNPEKYLSKIRNPFSRFFYRLNSKLFHGTFLIHAGMLQGKNEDILDSLNEYLKMASK